MAKILDLTTFKEELFELKLLDGTTIFLSKPNQAMFMKLIAFKGIDKTDPQGVLNTLTEMVLTILNSNTAQRKFSAEDIADYSFDMQQAIIMGYTGFVNEAMANPN